MFRCTYAISVSLVRAHTGTITILPCYQDTGIEYLDLEWFWNIRFSGVNGNNLHVCH